MKLSVSTLGCPGLSLYEVLDLTDAAGVDGIEVRGIGGIVDSAKIPCFSAKEAEATKALLLERGKTIVGLGTSVQLHDAEHFDAFSKEGLEAIEVAHRMNIPAIRVFGNDLPDGDGRKEAIDTLLKQYNILCDAAEDKGILVNLELHGTVNTVENIIPVLDGMSRRPSFGIIWDVMHTDRAYGDKWDPVYRLIRPFIRHVHIKDHERNSTPPFHLMPLGEGDIPLVPIVNRLLEDGYDGYFSFEWEKMWHPDLAPAEVVFPHFANFMKQFQ